MAIETASDSEFKTLRDEIREWQSRRFTIMGASGALAIAYVGWVVQPSVHLSIALASAPALLLGAGSAFLTAHCTRMGVRGSTYLQVFHSFQWQNRLERFKTGLNEPNVSQILALFHLAIVLCMVIVMASVCPATSNLLEWIPCGIAAMALLAAIHVLVFRCALNEEYTRIWRAVEAKESPASSPDAAPAGADSPKP